MRAHQGILVPLIVVLAAAGLAAGAVAVALPASAATTGAGFAGITPYGGYLGNYIAPDGTRVYCIDSGRDWPSGPTGTGHVTGELTTEWGTALDAGTLQRFNFVLTAYGQTTQAETAAAVNAYLYAFTSSWARSHGSGYSAGLHFINGNSAVEAAYAKVWAAAEASVASAGVEPTASISLELSSPRDGVVTIATTPRGAVGTLTLVGAVVAATGASSASVGDGDEVPIRGVPASGERSYSISAAAQFRATAPAGPAVTLFLTGDQQRTVRHAAPTELAFEAAASVGPIYLPFAPAIESRVDEPAVVVGDSLVDALTVTLTGADQEWPEVNGMPIEVVAVGTLYGPMQTEPTPSDEPPADAPVAGTARITLTGVGSYLSDGELQAPSQGYFTWVWRIDAADQSEQVRTVLGDDYRFTDRYGLAAETVHVIRPPELAATGSSTSGAAVVGVALLACGALAMTRLQGGLRGVRCAGRADIR